MGAFERLSTYNSRTSLRGTPSVTSDVFDVTTPKGAFLASIHKKGFKMYTMDGDTVRYTELHDAITTAGNQLVNAVAGSGKTTMLTFKIQYDIVTGEVCALKALPNGNNVRVINKVWVCTFLKSGASDLEASLQRWQRELGYTSTTDQIAFSTIDAEFKRCLNAMGVATPIAKDSKLSSLLRQAVDIVGVKRDNGYPLAKEDYSVISGIVTYYRGRLDGKKYQHPSMSDYNITPVMLDMLVRQFEQLRRSEGVMDFEDLMEYLYRYLYTTPNTAVQDFVSSRYNYIYIDEFQDTSQMAYAVLKFYMRGKLWLNRDGVVHDDILYNGYETLGKAVVIGDVSQTIYSFRGSDHKILAEYFDSDFRPTISALSVNWRCPSNILNPVVPSIHMNADSAKQNIVASKEGGEMHIYEFNSIKLMLDQLKEDLDRDMREGLTSAILCRTNYDGLVPALTLEAMRRYDFSVSGDGMTMNSPLAKKLIKVCTLFTERSSPNVKEALSFFIGRSTWQLTQMVDALKNSQKSVWTIPEDDIKFSCPNILPLVQMCKKIMMPDGVNRDRSKEVEALKAVYCYMIASVFDGDSAYCEAARAYIDTILNIMEERNFSTIYDFMEEFDYLNDRLVGRIKKQRVNIRIATVHEFKGKECDSVYIWNDSENVFPSNKCDINDEELLAEERRVHYIACTRARKYENIYTRAGSVGMFVKEMDAPIEVIKTPSMKLKKEA